MVAKTNKNTESKEDQLSLQLSIKGFIWSLPGYRDQNGHELLFTRENPGPVQIQISKLTDQQKLAVQNGIKDGSIIVGDQKIQRTSTMEDVSKEFLKQRSYKDFLSIIAPIASHSNKKTSINYLWRLLEEETQKDRKPRKAAMEAIRAGWNTWSTKDVSTTSEDKTAMNLVAEWRPKFKQIFELYEAAEWKEKEKEISGKANKKGVITPVVLLDDVPEHTPLPLSLDLR